MSTAETTVPPMSEVQRGLVLASMSATSMLFSMTLTIVNVILPTLQGAFSVTQDQVSWLVTLNIITLAIGMPLTGWIVARFGRRRTLIGSVSGFMAASLLCATANSFEMMMAYRILQGAAAATLLALPQAIVLDTFPRERQAFAQSIWGMAAVLGPAIAPSIGGFMSEAYGWRSAFLLMLPIGTLALVSIVFFVRDAGRDPGKRLDWTGFIALAVTIACLQIVFDRGQRMDWFDSPVILMLSGAAAVSFYIFVVQCATDRNAFISFRLFLDRNFSIGIVLAFIYGLLQIAPTVILPPFLQTLKGYPDTMIGVVLAMRGAGMFIGYFLAPGLTRVDLRTSIGFGAALTAWSGWLMAHLDFDSPLFDIAVACIIQGIGASIFWVPLSTLTFMTMPRNLLPQGTGIYHLVRTFGSSLYVAISVTIVLRSAGSAYAQLNQYVSVFNDHFGYPAISGAWNLVDLNGVARLEIEIGRQAVMVGYHNAFLAYGALAMLVVPCLLMVRRQS
ncbi:MAG: DHA2 family efflux MFS transporter permease subunit [Alphaproteobacteria bacterium]